MPTGFPLASKPQRACIVGPGTTFLQFQYNPSSFKDSQGVSYAEISSLGISYPILQYTGGVTRSISFDIYVNGVAGDGGPDVVYRTRNVLESFLPKPGNMFNAPPTFLFAFGSFIKECVLESLDIEYTLFTPQLEPLEATFSVVLKVIQS